VVTSSGMVTASRAGSASSGCCGGSSGCVSVTGSLLGTEEFGLQAGTGCGTSCAGGAGSSNSTGGTASNRHVG
jgi:hypothetical protein